MRNFNMEELDKLADSILSKGDKPDQLDDKKDDEKASPPAEAPKPEEISEQAPAASEKGEKKDEDKDETPTASGDEDTGESEDEEEPEPTEDEKKENVEKSLRDNFQANSTIARGMEASEFLTSVVEIISKSMADLVYEIQSGNQEAQDNSSTMAKSLAVTLRANQSLSSELTTLKAENDQLKKSLMDSIQELRNDLNTSVADLKSTFNEIASQPAGVRKSMGNINVFERNFNRSLNGGSADGVDSLSKSQIMDILNNELYKGNPTVQPSDIIAFESGAPLRGELRTLVSNCANRH